MYKFIMNGLSIWDQVFMQDKEVNENTKLLLLYLLTNPLSNITGVYQITENRINFDIHMSGNTLIYNFDVLELLKQVYRFGDYVIVKNAALFIENPTKKIIKEWNKKINALPIEVQEKLEEIGYIGINGEPFKVTKTQEKDSSLFESSELKKCYTAVLNKQKERKEPEKIKPPAPIRKELIIEEEEDENKKELLPPKEVPQNKDELIDDELIDKVIEDELIEDKKETTEEEETVEDILKEYEEIVKDDPTDWYFNSKNVEYGNKIDNEITEEDDPYSIPTEEEYLKKWQDAYMDGESEDIYATSDNCPIIEEGTEELTTEGLIKEEVITNITCNKEDKIIQNIDSFMDEGFYRQAYKLIANFIIQKNKMITENLGNKTIEYKAYYELFCNILEAKKDIKHNFLVMEYLSCMILDFLQYKGFYLDSNAITFARAYNGEGRQFIHKFRWDTLYEHKKFFSKKAMDALLDILYKYVENGEDKTGGLYCYYYEKIRKQDEKISTSDCTTVASA